MPSSVTPNPIPAPAPDPDQNGFERCKSNNRVGNPTLPNLTCFLDFVIDVLLLVALKEEGMAVLGVVAVGEAVNPIVCADIPFII